MSGPWGTVQRRAGKAFCLPIPQLRLDMVAVRSAGLPWELSCQGPKSHRASGCAGRRLPRQQVALRPCSVRTAPRGPCSPPGPRRARGTSCSGAALPGPALRPAPADPAAQGLLPARPRGPPPSPADSAAHWASSSRSVRALHQPFQFLRGLPREPDHRRDRALRWTLPGKSARPRGQLRVRGGLAARR